MFARNVTRRTARSRFARAWRAAAFGSIALLAAGSVAGAGQISTQPDPSNPANPWDHVGRQHNEALDHAVLARQAVGSTDAPLAAAMVGRVIEYAAQEYGEACSVVDVDFDAIGRIVADPAGANDLLLGMLGKSQRSYLLRIDEVASRLPVDTRAALEEMKALEAEILETLSADEAAPLLIGAAVGRYSNEYWNTQVGAEASPWLEGTAHQNGSAARKIPGWVKADLKGAISGGVGGIAGGWVGVGLGALIGGASASAIHAIDDL